MVADARSQAISKEGEGALGYERYAQVLGTLGLALFVTWAQVKPEDLLQLGNKGDDMWVKILGLVCVGVFVGAALIEARQLRKRKKDGTEPSDEDQQVDLDDDDSENKDS